MVVEELTFEVDPADQERWLRREHQVWAPFLSDQPGYVRKEVWQPDEDPSVLRVLVWWESMEAWRAVPDDAVEAVERQMGDLRRPSTTRSFEVLRPVG